MKHEVTRGPQGPAGSHSTYRPTYLCRLAERYGTDKAPALRRHGYTPFYDQIFRPLRGQVRSVLEIGIGHRLSGRPGFMGPSYVPGASLFMWRDYFWRATIHAIDREASVLVSGSRIVTAACDQADRPRLRQVFHPAYFDLIVDDGSHLFEHQICALEALLPRLRPGGHYVIEDVVGTMYRDLDTLMDECRQRGVLAARSLKHLRAQVAIAYLHEIDSERAGYGYCNPHDDRLFVIRKAPV
jgi:hypothetical protein